MTEPDGPLGSSFVGPLGSLQPEARGEEEVPQAEPSIELAESLPDPTERTCTSVTGIKT